MPGRTPSRHGVVLMLAIVALVVLLILSACSLTAGMQSRHDATRRRAVTVSMHLAESAADMASSYLNTLSAPPITRMNYPPDNSTIALDGGECWAIIVPDVGNTASWRKSYTIYAYGEADQTGMQSEVILRVMQQSFALYSYFTDSETSAITNDAIWFYSRDRIHGPVHTNDKLHITWDTGATAPIFYDSVSSNSSSAQWSPRVPGTTDDWGRVLSGGASAITFNVQRINLPGTTDNQKKAAWGGTNYPTTTGVYLPTFGSTVSAGVFVVGNCTLAFSVDAATGNQIIAIVSGSTTTTITQQLAAQQTMKKVGSGTVTTYAGVPNGVIYCTGNITAMSGVIGDNYCTGTAIVRRNAWTVATDVLAAKTVTITNALSYKTLPDATKSDSHASNLRAGTFGVVAEKIILSGTPNDMTLHGVYLAGSANSTNGSLYYAGWDTTKRGNLRVLGGIIQKKRGPVGTFNGNALQSGYNKDYNYDARMMNNPPPFFPTTGQFDVLSWQMH